MKKLASKCACSTSGIGICLCIVFMTISMAGTTIVETSKNTNSMAANGMSDMATTQTQNVFVNFFSGVWGEAILLISYGLMFFGIGSSGNKKVLPVAVVGAAILYISMYAYFSIPLEILGSIVLGFAFASAFSYDLAKRMKLA